ncbi:MAG: hypothetical protein ACQETG_08155, partial [Thermodesulfobacteriota bacterium]
VGISFFAPDRKRSMSLQKPIPTLGFLGSPISALRAIPHNLRLTPCKHARTAKYAAFFGIAQALILNFLRRHLKTYFLRDYHSLVFDKKRPRDRPAAFLVYQKIKKTGGPGAASVFLLALLFAQTGPEADPFMKIRHHQFLIVVCV